MSNETPTLSRRAMLGASLTTLACATAVAVPAAVAEINPDAELIRLGQERDAAFAHANIREPVLDDEELNERCEALNDIEFAIQDIPAQTLAGLAVKARIAAEYAPPVDPDWRLMDDILTSLIDDVLRLANVPAKQNTARLPTREA